MKLPDNSLYQNILGDGFAQLPFQLKKLHGATRKSIWAGEARVERGRGIVANLVAWILNLPKSSENTKVTVTFEPDGRGERWTRNFCGRKFSSYQVKEEGPNRNLLVERFGFTSVTLLLELSQDKLRLVPKRWTVLGISMPDFMLPGGDTWEYEDQGRFCFDVTIEVPLIGRVVAYRGWLVQHRQESDAIKAL